MIVEVTGKKKNYKKKYETNIINGLKKEIYSAFSRKYEADSLRAPEVTELLW